MGLANGLAQGSLRDLMKDSAKGLVKDLSWNRLSPETRLSSKHESLEIELC